MCLSIQLPQEGKPFEKTEDEYDIAVANEAYEEYLKDGSKSSPISELWKELEYET